LALYFVLFSLYFVFSVELYLVFVII
jgi:hypothetical protein